MLCGDRGAGENNGKMMETANSSESPRPEAAESPEAMPEADALLVKEGTAICVESLLDGRRLLALRVFVGAACGPRS